MVIMSDAFTYNIVLYNGVEGVGVCIYVGLNVQQHVHCAYMAVCVHVRKRMSSVYVHVLVLYVYMNKHNLCIYIKFLGMKYIAFILYPQLTALANDFLKCLC